MKSLDCTRHVCSKEVGESGTPHLQGAITFRKAYRLAALKKLHGKAHWGITKSLEHSENYCRKFGGEIILDINDRKQGARTDIGVVCDILKNGGTIKDVIEEKPEVFFKYPRNCHVFKAEIIGQKEIFVPCEVILIVGDTGKGKTKWAYAHWPNLFPVSVPKSRENQLWWDGYMGEETVLIDDFEGEIGYTQMLRICDGYKLRCEIKGGFIWKAWKRVIITSNYKLDEWYPRECTALWRRITREVSADEILKFVTETVTEVER